MQRCGHVSYFQYLFRICSRKFALPLSLLFLVFFAMPLGLNISGGTISTPRKSINTLSFENSFIIKSSSTHLLCFIPYFSKGICSAHVANSKFQFSFNDSILRKLIHRLFVKLPISNFMIAQIGSHFIVLVMSAKRTPIFPYNSSIDCQYFPLSAVRRPPFYPLKSAGRNAKQPSLFLYVRTIV